MNRYFDKEDFVCFLSLLETNKQSEIYLECIEDSSVSKYKFLKMEFAGSTIVLYEHPCGTVGIIQDSPIQDWDTLAKEVYEDFTAEGEYKMFFKTK